MLSLLSHKPLWPFFGHNYNCQPKTNKNKSKITRYWVGSTILISRPTYCVINVVCLLATFDPSPGAKSKQFFAAALCDRVSPITSPNISQNAWEFNRAGMYIIHGIYKIKYIINTRQYIYIYSNYYSIYYIYIYTCLINACLYIYSKTIYIYIYVNIHCIYIYIHTIHKYIYI